MLFYVLFMCFIVGTTIGINEITKEICSSLYPDELDPFIIPDAEMLPSVCPKLILYLECEENMLIEENADIDPILIGIKNVVRGICEENSQLQKDYLASVECFREFDNNVPPCDEAAQKIYLEYRHFITRFDNEDEGEGQYDDEDEEDSITYKEPYCMMSAYVVGCLGTNILDTCGQTALKTFVEIIQQSKILTQHCPEEEGHKLRSEFLDFLTFEKKHSHISIFRDVFDFKRKR